MSDLLKPKSSLKAAPVIMGQPAEPAKAPAKAYPVYGGETSLRTPEVARTTGTEELRVRKVGDAEFPVIMSTDREQAQLEALIMQTPNPAETMAKVEASRWLSKLTGDSISDIYKDYDSKYRAYMGELDPPTTGLKRIRAEWDRAALGVQLSHIGSEMMLYGKYDDEELWNQIKEIESRMPPVDDKPSNMMMWIAKGFANLLPTTLSVLTEGGKSAMVGAAAGAVAGSAVGAPAGPLGAASGAAGMMTLGWASGLVTGGQIEYMKLAAGNTFIETMRRTGKNGEKVNPLLATASSLGFAYLGSLLQPAKIARLTGGDTLMQNIVKKGIVRMATNPTARKIIDSVIADFVVRYGADITHQVMEELAEETFEQLGTTMAVFVTNQATEAGIPNDTIETFKEIWKQTASTTAGASILMSLPGAGIATANNNQAVGEAVAKIRERLGSTETLLESSESFKKGFERIARDPDFANLDDSEQKAILEKNFADYRKMKQALAETREALMDEPAPLIDITQTRREWEEALALKEAPEARLSEAIKYEPLRQLIEDNLPSLKPIEKDAAAILIDITAESMGMNTETYVNTFYEKGVFAGVDVSRRALWEDLTKQQKEEAPGGYRGKVEFNPEDGKALIYAWEKSDFSTWVHENAHVVRRQLRGQMADQAAAWAGAKKVNGEWDWTVEAEENFATAWEDYLIRGYAPNQDMGKLFGLMTSWMRQIYYTPIAENMNPEMRQVIDKMFTERDNAALVSAAVGSGALNQGATRRTAAAYETAVQMFGTTEDIEEAGFVLPEGQLINLSGKGGKFDKYKTLVPGTKRNLDHRAAEETGISLEEFVRGGAIRIDSRWGAVEIHNRPTPQQYSAIASTIDMKNTPTIAVALQDGKRTFFFTSEAASQVIVGQIKNFYDGRPVNERALYQGSAVDATRRMTYKSMGLIDEKMKGPMDSRALLAMLEKNGVKQEELEWLGIKDFLEESRKVTPEEIKNHIQVNQIEIKERGMGYSRSPEEILGDKYERYLELLNKMALDGITIAEEYEVDSYKEKIEASMGDIHTRYSSYTIPGGKDYHENLYIYINKEIEEYNKLIAERDKLMNYLVDQYREKKGEILGSSDEKEEGPYGGTVYNEVVAGKMKKLLEEYEEKRDKMLAPLNDRIAEMRNTLPTTYLSSHWSPINVLAHSRTKTRKTPTGESVLFVEEIQSDWHQAGREKGYKKDNVAKLGQLEKEAELAKTAMLNTLEALNKSMRESDPEHKNITLQTYTTDKITYIMTRNENRETRDLARAFMESYDAYFNKKYDLATAKEMAMSGTPDAPFKKTWHEFVFKRLLLDAVDNNYDILAWTTGDQQNERYNLGNHVSSLTYVDGTLFGVKNGTKVVELNLTENELPEAIGKDLAEKLLNQPLGDNGARRLDGENLRIGGSGMKGFYDKMLVDYANKLLKRYDVKVEDINTFDGTFHGIRLTDKVKTGLAPGLTLFQGAVKKDKAFDKWFGSSVVKNGDGTPMVVYRGLHGKPGGPQTKRGSYTFSSASLANLYAIEPNDKGDKAIAPRVLPAYIKIENPFVDQPNDPFLMLSEVEKKLGYDTAKKLAIENESDITEAGYWDEVAGESKTVEELLSKDKNKIKELDVYAYKAFDQQWFVAALKKAGYDGAIHGEYGEHTAGGDFGEYRVFKESQIRSAVSKEGPLGFYQGERFKNSRAYKNGFPSKEYAVTAARALEAFTYEMESPNANNYYAERISAVIEMAIEMASGDGMDHAYIEKRLRGTMELLNSNQLFYDFTTTFGGEEIDRVNTSSAKLLRILKEGTNRGTIGIEIETLIKNLIGGRRTKAIYDLADIIARYNWLRLASGKPAFDYSAFDAKELVEETERYLPSQEPPSELMKNLGDSLFADDYAVIKYAHDAGLDPESPRVKKLQDDLDREMSRINNLGGETSISRMWKKTRRIDLTGLKIRNKHDLAALASVYRNPFYEYSQIFYVDANDTVLAHNVLSMGLPASTYARDRRTWELSLKAIRERMTRLGADGVYMAHNHPSGDSTPSQGDLNVTEYVQENLYGFRGEIVLNGEKVSLIKNRKWTQFYYDPLKKYKGRIKPDELMATELMTLAKAHRGGAVVVLGAQAETISVSPLKKPTQKAIKQILLRDGGYMAVYITEDQKVFQDAVYEKSNARPEEDYIYDVLTYDGESFLTATDLGLDAGVSWFNPVIDRKNNKPQYFYQGSRLIYDSSKTEDQLLVDTLLPTIRAGLVLANREPLYLGEDTRNILLSRYINDAVNGAQQLYKSNPQRFKDAAYWYESINDARKELVKEIPSLKDENEWVIFATMMGIFGNGTPPHRNYSSAVSAYKYYKRTGDLFTFVNSEGNLKIISLSEGQIPGLQGVARNTLMAAQGKKLLRLIEEKGVDGAAKWLTDKHAAEEFKERDMLPTGMALKDEPLPGLFYLGNKLGAYSESFLGASDYTVKDLWMYRGYNRIAGTPVMKSTTNLEDLVGVKKADKVMAQTERNKAERLFLDEAIKAATKEINKALGTSLTYTQAQSVLWHREKDMWASEGVIEAEAGLFGEIEKNRRETLEKLGKYAPADEKMTDEKYLERLQEEINAVKSGKSDVMKSAMDIIGEEDYARGAVGLYQGDLERLLSGQISYEVLPGDSTGLSGQIKKDLSYRRQAQLLRAVDGIIAPNGKDLIADALGIKVVNRLILPGVWKDQRNPSLQVILDPETPLEGLEQKLDTYASVIGYLLKQDGVGWHLPIKGAEGTNVLVDLDRRPTLKQTIAIADAIDKNWNGAVAQVSSSEGWRLLNFTDLSLEKMMEEIAKIIKDKNIAARLYGFGGMGNLIENNWRDNNEGQSYTERIVAGGSQALLERARGELQPAIETTIKAGLYQKPRNYRGLAFWARGNTARDVDWNHINDVLDDPEGYGFKEDELRAIYAAAGEKWGTEGAAREKIIKNLVKTGWMRVRHYRKPRDYWSFTVNNEDSSRRDIEGFILDAIDNGMSINDELHIYSAATDKSSRYMSMQDFLEGEQGSLYQGALPKNPHYKAIEDAVASGKYVPERVLADYITEEWVQAELEDRRILIEAAIDYEEMEDYVGYMIANEAMIREPGYYEEMFKSSRVQTPSPEVKAVRVVNGISSDIIKTLLYDIDNAAVSVPVEYLEAAELQRDGRLSDDALLALRARIIEDPIAFRSLLETVYGVSGELESIIDEMGKAVEEELENEREAVWLEEIRNNPELDKNYAELVAEEVNTKTTLDAARENLKEALRSARQEARLQTKEGRAATQDALKSAKEEARLQTRMALDEAKRTASEAMKRYKDTQKLKKYVGKLIRRITKKPGNSIAWAQASEILAIQSQYRARLSGDQKAQQAALAGKISLLPDGPRKAELQDKEQIDLRTLKLSELEALENRVTTLRALGRASREAQLLREKTEIAAAVNEVLRVVLKGKPYESLKGKGSKQVKRKLRAGIKTKIDLNTLRPGRIAQELGHGEKTIIYRLLWKEVNQATDAELREIDRRYGEAAAAMMRLKITPWLLGEEITIDNQTYTRDQIISLYIGSQNPNSFEAILYGNKIDIDLMEKFIKKLSNNERAWGDWMIDSFDGDFERIAAVLLEDKNVGLNKVERYFPLKRDEINADPLNKETALELMSRTSYKKAYVAKGFAENRIKISEAHQTPMRLGATAVWMDAVAKQEKYISSGLLVKKLHRIFGNRDVKEAIAQVFGNEANDWLVKYINDFTNPNIYKTFDNFSQTSRVLRSHLATSALWLNLVTIAKQIPSGALYLGYAGPHNMAAAAGQFLLDPLGTIELVESLDPQVKNRSFSRFTEELKTLDKNTYERIVAAGGRIGMFGIAVADKVTVTIGWLAVYNKSKAAGMSESEARWAAQEATLATQPAARAKDLAQIYRTSEGFNWLLMFSNQLNQIWNITTYDIPNAIRKGNIPMASLQALGIIVSGLAIASISMRRLPEDEKEVGEAILMQLISGIPLFGGNIKSGLDGWWGTGVDPVPAAKSFGAAIRAWISDGDEEKRMKAAGRLLLDLFITMGLPTVQPRRAYKAIKNKDAWELIGGPPEEN